MIQAIGFGAYWHVIHGMESTTGRQDYHYHGLVIFGARNITPFCLGSTYTGRGRAFSLWFFGARNITRVNLGSVLHWFFGVSLGMIVAKESCITGQVLDPRNITPSSWSL